MFLLGAKCHSSDLLKGQKKQDTLNYFINGLLDLVFSKIQQILAKVNKTMDLISCLWKIGRIIRI